MTGKSSYIFIITGKPGSGKTSFSAKLVERLRKRKITISGFLAHATSRNRQNQAYEIQNIKTGETLPLASASHIPGWIKMGNFSFNPKAVLFGNKILTDLQLKENELVVVDEIGPFELNDKLWSNSVSYLLSISGCYMIWVVRNTLIEKVIQKWSLRKSVILDIEKLTVQQAEYIILLKLRP